MHIKNKNRQEHNHNPSYAPGDFLFNFLSTNTSHIPRGVKRNVYNDFRRVRKIAARKDEGDAQNNNLTTAESDNLLFRAFRVIYVYNKSEGRHGDEGWR